MTRTLEDMAEDEKSDKLRAAERGWAEAAEARDRALADLAEARETIRMLRSATSSSAATTVTALDRLVLMEPVVRAAVRLLEHDGDVEDLLRKAEAYRDKIKDRV